MDDTDWLAQRFEERRPFLRGMAYRMLGSMSEADDAVQEAWLRVMRADVSAVKHLDGWLTTIVARSALNLLRSRRARREEPFETTVPEPLVMAAGGNPEDQVVAADAVGLALLVVLETLEPDERLAFVLHDMFAVPFAEIGPIVGRTPAAARQLASRARRRVRGAVPPVDADLDAQREVVDAFVRAAREGDLPALLAVLHPDVEVRADRAILGPGVGRTVRGADAVAVRASGFRRFASDSHPVVVNGAPGLFVAPGGRPFALLAFAVSGGRIAAVDVVTAPAVLGRLAALVGLPTSGSNPDRSPAQRDRGAAGTRPSPHGGSAGPREAGRDG